MSSTGRRATVLPSSGGSSVAVLVVDEEPLTKRYQLGFDAAIHPRSSLPSRREDTHRTRPAWQQA